MYLRVNAKVWMSALNANPPPARKYAERVLKYTSASAMASSEYVGNTETVSPSNEIFKWVRNPHPATSVSHDTPALLRVFPGRRDYIFTPGP